METALSVIAQWVDGKIIGDPSVRIRGVRSLEDAEEGDIAFVKDPKHYKKAQTTKASAILSREKIPGISKPLLLVDQAALAFTKVLARFYPPRQYPAGVDPHAIIGPNVRLGKEVSIGPYVVLEEGVRIGDRARIGASVVIGRESEVGEDSLLYPHVTLYEKVQIGKRVILHSGCVIGADGFGFTPYQSRHIKIPQVGGVIIEDDVELGANVTVDRATLGQTRIGEGTKVDNQVHIGHNVTIGPHSILVAQVGISGSVTIGHHVILAGQVGVVDHVEIGDHVTVGARSVITRNIKDNESVLGFPALPYKEGVAVLSSLKYLPQLRTDMKRLTKKQRGTKGSK